MSDDENEKKMGDDGNGSDEDRISHLPDFLLSMSILSLLPIKQSARTSVLSSRWRRLWLLSPLTIDDGALHKDDAAAADDDRPVSWFLNTVTHILSVHPGPVRICRLGCCSWDNFLPELRRLLKTLTQRGLQELTLVYLSNRFLLPHCIMQCESLRVLQLAGCVFPDPLPWGTFTNLKTLRMYATEIYNITFDFVAIPPITELEVENCIYLDELCIDSSTLRTLILNEPLVHSMKEVVIKDAPNLEHLILGDNFTAYTEVTIRNAPKLEVLKCVDMRIAKLRLGESQFDVFTEPNKFSSFSTRMHSLRTLAIKVNFNYGYQAKVIPYLLRCFPCLETLDVLINDMVDEDDDDPDSPDAPYGEYWKQRFDIDCLDHHLKSVKLIGFLGQQTDLDFAKFIISKARVLKVMTLICGASSGRKWLKTQRQRLCLKNRASADARVVFLKDQGSLV